MEMENKTVKSVPKESELAIVENNLETLTEVLICLEGGINNLLETDLEMASPGVATTDKNKGDTPPSRIETIGIRIVNNTVTIRSIRRKVDAIREEAPKI